MNSMEKTRAFLRSIGLPGGDAYDLPTSSKRFADGGQYRFEVPGIPGPQVMQALLNGRSMKKSRLTENRLFFGVKLILFAASQPAPVRKSRRLRG